MESAASLLTSLTTPSDSGQFSVGLSAPSITKTSSGQSRSAPTHGRSSVLRRPLDAFDHHVLDRSPRCLKRETQLLLNGRHQGRNIVDDA